MASSLPPTGTHCLLELVSPHVPDAFIHDLCPRQFTGGRRYAWSAPQLWRVHRLPLLTSTHSLNLVVAQLPEPAAGRRFCRLRRHWPGARMLHEFRQQVGVRGLRRINQHLLERLLRRQGVQPYAVALLDATDLPAACSDFPKKHRHFCPRGVGRAHPQDRPEPLVCRLQETHAASVAAHGASLGDVGAAGHLAGACQRGRGRIAEAQFAMVCAALGWVAGSGCRRPGLSGSRKQKDRTGKLSNGRGDQAPGGQEAAAALRRRRARGMSARGATGVRGARSGNGAAMVSRGERRNSVRGVLASRRLPATLRVSGRRARNAVWLAAAGQPSRPAAAPTSPAVDRTGAVLREESTGLGAEVLQQPAVCVADELVGR